MFLEADVWTTVADVVAAPGENRVVLPVSTLEMRALVGGIAMLSNPFSGVIFIPETDSITVQVRAEVAGDYEIPAFEIGDSDV
jgi:hypothetical protein